MARAMFQPGDRVRIVGPMFDRCGYPLTHDDVVAELGRAENHEKMQALMMALTDLNLIPARFTWGSADIAIPDRLMKELAYHGLKCRGFGGRDRTIHTTPCPELIGKETVVVGARMVQTGRYYGPSGSYDDYEPGGLSDQKAVRIVEVENWGFLWCVQRQSSSSRRGVEFPASSLELVKADELEQAA